MLASPAWPLGSPREGGMGMASEIARHPCSPLSQGVSECEQTEPCHGPLGQGLPPHHCHLQVRLVDGIFSLCRGLTRTLIILGVFSSHETAA